jgi:hypothetical protein
MNPIRTLATNFDYLPPAGMADCVPLPVTRTSDGRTISVWEFTDEERRRIAAGENLELHVWQQPPPPVGMMLTKATETKKAPYSERCGKRVRLHAPPK